MDRGDRQKCLKACRNALPPHDQTTIFLLEPGKCPLGLEPRHHLFDGSATVFLRLPDPLGYLGSDTTLAKLLPEGFGIIPFIRRDDLEAFARAATFPRADLDRIEQRHSLSALISIGRRDAVRQGHPAPVGQAVDENPFAFAPTGDALAPTLARGKKRHPRRHTPNESSLFPQPRPESGPAWRPMCHPSASVAASDASHSSTPIVARAGYHTIGTR